MDYTKLIPLTKAFAALTPWDYISDEKIFIVRHPETNINYYCSILGNSAIEFGLNAFVGTKGYLNILSLFDEGPVFDLMERTEMLALNFDEEEFLSDEDFEIIRANDIDYIEGLGYCQFSSKKAGFTFESLTAEEIKLMEIILEQSIAIVKAFRKRPEKLLLPGVDQFKARVYKNNHWITTTITPEIHLTTLEVNPFVTRSLSNRYPIRYCQWEVGFYYMSRLVNEADQQPFFPGVILIADTENFQIIAQEVYNPHENNLLVQVKELMIRTIRKLEMIPSHVVFDDLEVSVGLRSFVEALTIDYMYNPYPDVIDDIKMNIIDDNVSNELESLKNELEDQGLSIDDVFNSFAQQEDVDDEILDLLKDLLNDQNNHKF